MMRARAFNSSFLGFECLLCATVLLAYTWSLLVSLLLMRQIEVNLPCCAFLLPTSVTHGPPLHTGAPDSGHAQN